MLKVYSILKEGTKEGSVEDLSTPSICWANCIAPTEDDLKGISQATNISIDDLKETLDEEERPKVSDLENYSLIIISIPWEANGTFTTKPLAIFVSKTQNNVITMSLNEVSSIKKLELLIKTKKVNIYDKGIGFFTYSLVDLIFGEYFTILSSVDERIDDIEDKVIEKPDKTTINNLFSIKKTLIYFHRALTANREVITSIEKEYITNIDKKNIKRFRNLYNDVTQLIETEGTYRDILTGILEIYLSSISNNLNQVMKTLTVVASFILLPTLIAGIYGMNFDTASKYNMPELLWKYGYFFALGLMVFSVASMYIFFRKKGWI